MLDHDSTNIPKVRLNNEDILSILWTSTHNERRISYVTKHFLSPFKAVNMNKGNMKKKFSVDTKQRPIYVPFLHSTNMTFLLKQ